MYRSDWATLTWQSLGDTLITLTQSVNRPTKFCHRYSFDLHRRFVHSFTLLWTRAWTKCGQTLISAQKGTPSFELFCQGCFHIFLQHAGVGNSRNCIPRHMVAHHRFHPAYTQQAEAVDVTSTASACFLINPAAEKLRCCRSCCHGQSRF